MTRTYRLWAAFGRAIAANASTKQINGIVQQLDRARAQSRDA